MNTTNTHPIVTALVRDEARAEGQRVVDRESAEALYWRAVADDLHGVQPSADKVRDVAAALALLGRTPANLRADVEVLRGLRAIPDEIARRHADSENASVQHGRANKRFALAKAEYDEAEKERNAWRNACRTCEEATSARALDREHRHERQSVLALLQRGCPHELLPLAAAPTLVPRVIAWRTSAGDYCTTAEGEGSPGHGWFATGTAAAAAAVVAGEAR